MNPSISNTLSLENSSISREDDKIVNEVIRFLQGQNITDITEQKSILTRACTKLSEQPVELLELELPQTISALSKQNRVLLKANIMKIKDAFKNNTAYFISLLYTCVEYGILTKNDKDIIQSKSTNCQKHEEFLSILPKRGNKAEAVIKELQKQNIISAT